MRGECHCGAVTFEADAQPVGVINCHCTDCQKMHGNFNAMAGVAKDALTITGPIQWYESSEKARRGFCPTCGARMFKDNLGGDRMMISMGVIAGSTGLRPFRNIFTESKGDWYDPPAEEPPRFDAG
ncbi:MAG: GFA family protein [Pseudomonadota bacterium]